MRTRSKQNEFQLESEVPQQTLSVFNLQGYLTGKVEKGYLTLQEVKAAHLLVLLNCTEFNHTWRKYYDRHNHSIYSVYIKSLMTNFGSLFKKEKQLQNQSLHDEEVDAMIEAEFSIRFRDNVSGIYVPDSHYFRYLWSYVTD